jgi:carbamoyltransferase
VAATKGCKLNWQGPYLGHDIGRPYPVEQLVESLLANPIAAVAAGKAEFGPRALGNRSLVADPRGNEIKDKVNEIKRRQKFRPFAPMILEERVHDYFEMPKNINTSPYMQFVARCKHPTYFPAIIHADGTSRVQTVNEQQHPGLYQALKLWEDKTGCPILLNTSLNIRGKPMVNTIEHAYEFRDTYGINLVV